MDDDFDIEGAVNEVSEGLALEVTSEVTDLNTPFESTPKAKGDEADVTDVEAKPAPAATPAAAAPSTPPAPPAPGDLKAPASWRPEAKAEFDKLPPVIKDEVLKREEDILRGIGEYRAAANFGQAVDKAIAPYIPALRQHGLDPVRHVGELMQAHHALALGTPQQKQEMLLRIAKDYKIDLPSGQQPDADSPYVDPEVKRLQDQLSQLQSVQQQLVHQHTAAQQQQIQQIRSSLTTELNTFAADPEHAFFDEVAPDMAMLIQSGRASSLKQAYDLALRMSPAALEKESLRLAAKEAAKKQVPSGVAAAKTTAARNATGVNVKASGSGSQGARIAAATPGLQNMEKSMEAEFDRIMAGG